MGKLTVLVCPMDWGLGHASRCVPVIRAFMDAGCRVVVAASGGGAELIRREFDIPGDSGQTEETVYSEKRYSSHLSAEPVPERPEPSLTIVPYPGFTVSYSRLFLFLKLMLQAPSFLYHLMAERRMIEKLVREHGAGLVVSDNRYGAVHPGVHSVIITHQLHPLLPCPLSILERPLSMVIRRWVRRFDECWIPDHPEEPACGKLIRGRDRLPAVRFTGWLSRFPHDSARSLQKGKRENPERSGVKPFRYRVMYILSGPEPQRTILEEIILSRKGDNIQRRLLVRGLPGGPPGTQWQGNTGIVSFLDSPGLLEAMRESELIVCRAGYSSVMDMLVTGKKALLVPTPGQTEQEYLARRLGRKGWFRVVAQKRFDPDIIIDQEGRDRSAGAGDCSLLHEAVGAAIKRAAGRNPS